MIKWLLKISIWATEARKWHGYESWWREWCPPHLLQQLQLLIGPTPIFWAFFIIFWSSFWRLIISSRRHKSQRIKLLYYLLCHGDTQRELVKHSLDPPCAFIYFLLSGLPFLGGLVHFDKLWLYWSMYCMLSSSQPLIRTFHLLILATRFESG